MKAWAKILAALAFLCIFIPVQAAEIPNTSVFSQTDGSNNSGTVPTWAEGMAPSQLNDSARALQGAITREWNWGHPTISSTGSANAYVLTYSVAPAAYYNGQRFCFEANFATSGASTANVNSLGAIAIKYLSAGSLTDTTTNTIRSGDRPCLTYRSTGPSFVIENLGTASATAATTTEQLTGTSTTVTSTPDSVAALWEKGSDIASAGTISIGEGGFFHVTGTTTITDIDFGTATNGRCARLEFDGALTLTHNATTLVLPGGANITTAAGDQATVCQDSSDNVHVTQYTRKDGRSILAFTGDSGSGGAIGLVPAPASGDAAANKYLKSDGTWAAAGSAWTLIETLNPSGASEQDTSNLSNYNIIRLSIYGLTPAANSGLTIQKSTDGSSFTNWSDGLVIDGQLNATATSESYTNNPAGSSMLSQGDGGSNVSATASDGGWNGTITIYNFNQGEIAYGNFQGLFKVQGGSNHYVMNRGGFYDTGTTARTHLRLVFNGQNIASGRITVEGIK